MPRSDDFDLLLASAGSVGELAAVNWFVHDAVFELEQLDWRPQDRCVILPLSGLPGRPSGRSTASIVVRDVVSVEVNDRAGVGTYDVLELRYAPSRQWLVLEANIPLEIVFHVEAVSVELWSAPDARSLGA